MITLKDFSSESQGKTFADVIKDSRINFQEVIDFFNDTKRLIRMEDSENHHDRPALAGVIKEFEESPNIKTFLSKNDAHTTFRFRQAVGALVRMHMESRGWEKTGTKGSLGTRGKVKPNSTKPGSYINKHGLSKWFTRTERYIKK
jgi:hypothetical protein